MESVLKGGDGETSTKDLLESFIFETPPVNFETFTKSFLNETAWPLQLEPVQKLFGTDGRTWENEYEEGLFLWGMGSGKDWTLSRTMAWVVYWCMNLRDPQEFFGQAAGEPLDLVCVSFSARQARNVFFKRFINTVRRAKNPETGKNWFEERGVDLRPSQDIKKDEVNFTKALTVHALNSDVGVPEGLNILFSVFDEVGEFKVDKARELHDVLKNNTTSRFKGRGKMAMLSYKRSDNDFMMVRFNEATKEPRVYRSKHATWEVNITTKKSDFSQIYEKNPEKAKRVFECEGQDNEGGFFKYLEEIRGNVNIKRQIPFLCGEKDYWTTDNRLMGLPWKQEFRGIPGMPYYVHVDLGAGGEGQDSCGIAMAHTLKKLPHYSPAYIERLRIDEGLEVQNNFTQEEKGVCLDLVLQVRSLAGGEIIFDNICAFIEQLKTKLGFDIRLATFDGWQSKGPRQTLEARGIRTDYQSVDKTPEAYEILKSMMYRGLLDYYAYKTFLRECEEVTQDGTTKKVDHPKLSQKRLEEEGIDSGSKDCSDAAAGAVKLAYEGGVGSKISFWVG